MMRTKSETGTPQARPTLSLAVQYATEASELPRWRLRRWLLRALEIASAEQALSGASLTLRLVDEEEGQALNRAFRERDYATNVLTFEYGIDPEGIVHGDIVICIPVLVREAAAQQKPFLAHAAHLSVHGALHALGYDHLEEAEATHMEALETQILATFGIEDPYTPR